MKELLIEKINNSCWWHVPPRDPNAYEKRGKFLTSTYQQAEFYGRPNLSPEKVAICNPLFGFSEREILKTLFGENIANKLSRNIEATDSYKARIDLDAKMHNAAVYKGYDAIVLMTPSGRNALEVGRKPISIELNLCKVI